jgi:hypothetical protein
MRLGILFGVGAIAGFGMTSFAPASTVCSQMPGTGTARSSQLWQDPGPNGNDLDGDSVIWSDFVLGAPAQINHLEWWGTGACELGFRVQFWKQDPGTIAYQPIGLFYYGGNHSVRPEATFDFAPSAYTQGAGPNGTTHFTLDLATPVPLAANDPTNVRWFVAIIGLTHQAYAPWNWAQGNGGSTRCFQFVRGGTSGGGPLFRSLPEGRAIVVNAADPVVIGACCMGTGCAVGAQADCTTAGGAFQGEATACGPVGNPTTCCPVNFDGAGGVQVADIFAFLNAWFASDARTDFDGSGVIQVADIFAFLNAWFAGC